MYKLTYESDEDISVPVNHVTGVTSDGERYSTMDEDVIYDKNKDGAGQSDTEKGRSQTMASAVMSAHAVKNDSGVTEKPRSRKFYQMFNNSSHDDLKASKAGANAAAIGCKVFLLAFFILVLSGFVVFLLITTHGIVEKNQKLNDRVHYLEASVQLLLIGKTDSTATSVDAPPKPSDNAPPIPSGLQLSVLENSVDGPPPPPPVMSDAMPIQEDPAVRRDRAVPQCCTGVSSKLDKAISDFQLHNTALKRLETQINTNKKQITALGEKTTNMEMQDVAIEDQVWGSIGPGRLVEAAEGKPSSVSSACPSVVAFSLNQAISVDAADTQGIQTSTYEIKPQKGQVNTIYFNNEMMKKPESVVNGINGVFIAPCQGTYFLQVDFCTAQGTSASLALRKMETSLRIFSTPATNATTPVSHTTPHSFAMLTELNENDVLFLVLLQGSIVEKSDVDSLGTESCTRFSGFRIH
uniref:Uncharacterized LOC100183091 n=1 Tax=Ciona intestinalis TaxID=7719 RepID=F6V4D1_CIOIN|nr:uncharacterized protein LOC100183091 [Ciona intestinalis]|eukprot:XP_026691238.1 uncharacterized protein LOC100183091 [Ciona intestinalis]